MNPIIEAAFVDELEKIAAAVSLAKKKGLGRLGELITGSREKKLEERGKHLVARKHRVDELATTAGKKLKQEPGEGAFDHFKRQQQEGSSTRYKVQDAIHANRSDTDRESEAVNKTLGSTAGALGVAAGTAFGVNRLRKKKTDDAAQR